MKNKKEITADKKNNQTNKKDSKKRFFFFSFLFKIIIIILIAYLGLEYKKLEKEFAIKLNDFEKIEQEFTLRNEEQNKIINFLNESFKKEKDKEGKDIYYLKNIKELEKKLKRISVQTDQIIKGKLDSAVKIEALKYEIENIKKLLKTKLIDKEHSSKENKVKNEEKIKADTNNVSQKNIKELQEIFNKAISRYKDIQGENNEDIKNAIYSLNKLEEKLEILKNKTNYEKNNLNIKILLLELENALNSNDKNRFRKKIASLEEIIFDNSSEQQISLFREISELDISKIKNTNELISDLDQISETATTKRNNTEESIGYVNNFIKITDSKKEINSDLILITKIENLIIRNNFKAAIETSKNLSYKNKVKIKLLQQDLNLILETKEKIKRLIDIYQI